MERVNEKKSTLSAMIAQLRKKFLKIMLIRKLYDADSVDNIHCNKVGEKDIASKMSAARRVSENN